MRSGNRVFRTEIGCICHLSISPTPDFFAGVIPILHVHCSREPSECLGLSKVVKGWPREWAKGLCRTRGLESPEHMCQEEWQELDVRFYIFGCCWSALLSSVLEFGRRGEGQVHPSQYYFVFITPTLHVKRNRM